MSTVLSLIAYIHTRYNPNLIPYYYKSNARYMRFTAMERACNSGFRNDDESAFIPKPAMWLLEHYYY